MGQISSKIMRPLRNFNVDNRANRVLEKRQKVAVPAPKHAKDAERISRFREEHPEFLEAQMKKDEKLHENLKHVYVTSKDTPDQTKTSSKPLPLERQPPPETELGAMDPTYDVPEGRVSLKNVFGFLGQYQTNREEFTAEKIAEDYKLDKQEVQNVLDHFKIFHLHLPKEMIDKNKNLKKYVEGQMKDSIGISSSFRLPGGSEQKKINTQSPDSDDLSPSKT